MGLQQEGNICMGGHDHFNCGFPDKLSPPGNSTSKIGALRETKSNGKVEHARAFGDAFHP